jgi:hypothetical protein
LVKGIICSLRCRAEGRVAFRGKSFVSTLGYVAIDWTLVSLESASVSLPQAEVSLFTEWAPPLSSDSTDRFTATLRPVQFTAAKATEFNYPVAAPHNGASRWSFASAGVRSLTVAILILRVVGRLLLGDEWTGMKLTELGDTRWLPRA